MQMRINLYMNFQAKRIWIKCLLSTIKLIMWKWSFRIKISKSIFHQVIYGNYLIFVMS